MTIIIYNKPRKEEKMERKIDYLSICYTMFLILLLLSGSTTGILSQLSYASAFILPIALGLLLNKKSVVGDQRLFSISKDDVKFTLPVVAPTVAVIMLISALTSMVIVAITGRQNVQDVGDSLVFALVSHAMIPAVLEEMLFRYLPMKILSEDSTRLTVLASALFFALSHHSLFSIPYAFVAGVIFMALDIKAKSIIPSLILHFINNAISVGMLVYADNEAFTPSIIIILGILLVISLIFIAKNREKYLEAAKALFKKDAKLPYPLPLQLFTLLSLFIAVISLM